MVPQTTPTSSHTTHSPLSSSPPTSSPVLLAFSTLSFLFSAFSITSYLLFPPLRHTRTRLVLYMSLCDCLVALNFMVSAAVSVNQEAGGETELKGKFCTANGAFTQWFIVQSDYWVLVIALCTYAVFRPPGPTSLLRRALPYLLHLPYTLSLLQSILGATLVGYVDVGSWCWFGSDKIRFLWNYTQRISIGLVITAIYVKLWTVLRRGGCDFGDEEVGVEERVIGEVGQTFDGSYEAGVRDRDGKAATDVNVTAVTTPEEEQDRRTSEATAVYRHQYGRARSSVATSAPSQGRPRASDAAVNAHRGSIFSCPSRKGTRTSDATYTTSTPPATATATSTTGYPFEQQPQKTVVDDEDVEVVELLPFAFKTTAPPSPQRELNPMETEISSPPSLTPSRTPLTSSTCPDSNLITPSANCSTSQPRRTLTSHQDFRMLLYPVAYLTIWILPTACRIYAWSHGHHVGYGWGVAEKSMICLSGAINSVVYWMNGRVVGAWVGWPRTTYHDFARKPPMSDEIIFAPYFCFLQSLKQCLNASNAVPVITYCTG
ncbi:hypothetical protein G7K_6733-t1 [Saitoella complicata NRRL Y-17804]|uniref:G-protein coupled receptors family 2 profile 2 domain-containing protein n=1 Tax=Saitoella complicata (strain BCRC 22490 / CBS 7301 / JCM 7358 / NBRC 10748 / NRRL Y-17804) TaxID=698492 RepID=A0A0E9NSL2_SAICN|nr:hypothetical protein G7K_6733-t1 [Saitoella complicata NRRL Y-17804]